MTKVYRVDVIGKKETLFGVAMKGEGDNKYMDDKYIMSKSTSRMSNPPRTCPMTYWFPATRSMRCTRVSASPSPSPDLSMMGANSFMNIMKAPEAIRTALALTAGGKEDAR